MTDTPNETLYSRRFFDEQSTGSLASARVVLKELFEIAKFNSVVDVGCGVAPWLRTALDFGVDRGMGLDGDYVNRDHLLVDPAMFQPCDLEKQNIREAVGTHVPFDIALCMEVAEHISYERASSFIEELCSLSDLILFSAAVPGQGGTKHINEQWPIYWARLFANNGFICFDVLRSRIWDRDECEWWYIQNALVFAKQGTDAIHVAERLGIPDTSVPLSIIHPRVVPHVEKYAGERIAEQLALHHPFGRENSVGALEAKLDKLRTIIERKTEEASSLDASLAQYRAKIERLQMEAIVARDERNRLAAAIAAMYASTSWRLTNPARRIIKLFRG